MTIFEKLVQVQNELKAPKSQYNSFGKYHYRNQEDILEAVKPLLKKYSLALVLSDEVKEYLSRYYILATAKLTDTETGQVITNTAFAREEDDKKGMDGSQITGAASSYARKYALNGLFLIDDTKDSDHTNTNETIEKPQKQTITVTKPHIPIEESKETPKEKSSESALMDADNSKCFHCNSITQSNVVDYSNKKFGKTICYACQQKGLK